MEIEGNVYAKDRIQVHLRRLETTNKGDSSFTAVVKTSIKIHPQTIVY